MWRSRISLIFKAVAIPVVLISALQHCDAFVQPSQHISGTDRLHSSLGRLAISMAKNSNDKIEANNEPATARSYTAVEDGSPLGVAVVGLGFLALQLFGDRLDKSAVEQYAAPFILCSASLAAGISRLVRNSKGWREGNNERIHH